MKRRSEAFSCFLFSLSLSPLTNLVKNTEFFSFLILWFLSISICLSLFLSYSQVKDHQGPDIPRLELRENHIKIDSLKAPKEVELKKPINNKFSYYLFPHYMPVKACGLV